MSHKRAMDIYREKIQGVSSLEDLIPKRYRENPVAKDSGLPKYMCIIRLLEKTPDKWLAREYIQSTLDLSFTQMNNYIGQANDNFGLQRRRRNHTFEYRLK